VQVNTLGRFPVKGLAEPVEVFELVGASTIRGRLQASAARRLTRFVGRQQKLAALQQALERAEAGHGHVAALVGEAGVRKRRPSLTAWSRACQPLAARVPKIGHFRQDLDQWTRVCYHGISSIRSVLARVGERLASNPPRGAKRFITPLTLSVNHATEN
jgi:hypothetical protein